jgi:hypothetical protein
MVMWPFRNIKEQRAISGIISIAGAILMVKIKINVLGNEVSTFVLGGIIFLLGLLYFLDAN